ncbi:MAG: DUF3368 domain-containing protein [Cytophagales bacterium]|nr:MAG: DUF3368 domain-containing protein [Cytophagales bacterium]
MRSIIIADTSCFVILQNIGELDLLFNVYEEIITTIDIAKEFGESLPEWVKIKNVADNNVQKLLELQLDKGESSAIALALETQNSILILDDFKARKIAKILELKFTGTIGVIIKAKLYGFIPSIKPYIQKIKLTNFRITPEIEMQALIEANEL